VIVSVPGCSLSTVLIDELCKRNIPLVISGQNFLPCNFTVPVEGYSKQYKVMTAQVGLSAARRKRAWQQVVRNKISNQAKVLSYIGQSDAPLRHLVKRVKSGDKENCEAQAARIYWQKLFGNQFRRRKEDAGLNSALNYAYTIVRSCTARGVVAAGLHPTFSMNHKNPKNAFNLVDDLMEPFRPVADYMIWCIRNESLDQLRSEMKAYLAALVSLRIYLEGANDSSETSPLSLAAVKMCKSFADYCLHDNDIILKPDLPKPLDFPTF